MIITKLGYHITAAGYQDAISPQDGSIDMLVARLLESGASLSDIHISICEVVTSGGTTKLPSLAKASL